MYGDIRFGYGYLVIPRGTIYQFQFDGSNNKIIYRRIYDTYFDAKKV